MVVVWAREYVHLNISWLIHFSSSEYETEEAGENDYEENSSNSDTHDGWNWYALVFLMCIIFNIKVLYPVVESVFVVSRCNVYVTVAYLALQLINNFSLLIYPSLFIIKF